MEEDNPRQKELMLLAWFCKKKKIYIYGNDIPQKMIFKYLRMSNIAVSGFVVADKEHKKDSEEVSSVVDFEEARALKKKGKLGIIIAEPDYCLGRNNHLLKLMRLGSVFFISNWNRRTISKKMLPRLANDFFLEVNLADHCNLNCQCCDHFSPIASKTFLDFDQYVKDIKRIAELTGGELGLLKLQGGEPLLNDRINDYISVSREVFPNAVICVFTDGLLLTKLGSYDGDNNFWKIVSKYEIEVRMTRYPIRIDIDRIIDQAKLYNVSATFDPPIGGKGARLWILSEIGKLSYHGVKRSVKHPFDLCGNQEKYRFISCYQFNESIVLRDGKIFTCPMIPYSHYFNERFDQNLEVKDDCFIDIYKANSFFEIADFCTRRTSFCDYCAVHKRKLRKWRQSKHDMEEWTLDK